MEWLILGLFCAALLLCICLQISLFYALLFGLGLFLLYGKSRGFSWRALFRLHWTALIPAVMILLLSLLRVKVKLVMLASILAAVPLCLWLQDMTTGEIAKTLITGFEASDPELAAMINGGGLFSMVKVVAMMCLTSSFSKLLQETGLLKKATDLVERAAEKTTSFAAILLTAVVTSMISCSQMLAILLTEQLCRGLAEDQKQFANDLEDTTVIVAPLFPWSMAVAVPLATLGVPDGALLCACYLYLLPLWRLGCSFLEKFQKKRIGKRAE